MDFTIIASLFVNEKLQKHNPIHFSLQPSDIKPMFNGNNAAIIEKGAHDQINTDSSIYLMEKLISIESGMVQDEMSKF